MWNKDTYLSHLKNNNMNLCKIKIKQINNLVKVKQRRTYIKVYVNMIDRFPSLASSQTYNSAI